MKNSSDNRTAHGRPQARVGSKADRAHDHKLEIARAKTRLPGARIVNETAGLFDILSHPMRLRIVLALRPRAGEQQPELCVSDLAELLDASESLTSHQLRILRDAAVVGQRKAGKLVLYHLADGSVDRLLPKW